MSVADAQDLRRTCLCGRLLCVQVGQALHIKHRETRFVAFGPVEITCGRCRRSATVSVVRARGAGGCEVPDRV